MFKLILVVSAVVACVSATPGAVLAAAYTAPVVTAHSSQVIARNYNGLAAPLVAAAPAVAVAAPFRAAPLAVAAPAPVYAAAAYKAAPLAVATPFAAYKTAPVVAAPFTAPFAAPLAYKAAPVVAAHAYAPYAQYYAGAPAVYL